MAATINTLCLESPTAARDSSATRMKREVAMTLDTVQKLVQLRFT
jgi:hypothetical protein